MTFRRLFLCLSAAVLFSGCSSVEEPRIRAGIQDPVERHPHRSWHFPSLLPDDISVTSLPGSGPTA